MGWESAAACRGADPEVFFPPSSATPEASEVRRAKAICARCPVRLPCRLEGLRHEQLAGVWGGLTETERQAERAQWARSA
jgi:WhiB family transcriptional regulator, redox-sensing transcriptional regulator